ncbi:hypothetical protein [Streptomyces sp. cg40]|uniref:hypothetical protein n=1 Tax=Streptomyces sp. cg40 TaxID=3419764 RepID=UPI003CFDF789
MSVNDDVIKVGVVSDADYMGRLFRDIQAANDVNVSATVPLCMAPYFSLMLHEAKGKTRTIDSSVFAEFSVEAEQICARARHGLKLFEDTQRPIDEQLQYFEDDILNKHSAEFLGNTWLKFARRWERDLGLFTYDDVLVTTSHAAAFQLGVDADKLFQGDGGAYRFEIMRQVGRCFAALGARMDTQGGETFVCSLSGARMKSKDVLASPYYAKAFNGAATKAVINLALTDLQVRMNFINKVITAGADIRNLEYTVFKIRYITLYQVLSSLKLLKGDARYPLPLASSVALDNILDTDSVRIIMDGAARGFRNTLMHYNLLRSVDTTKVDLSRPIFGLVPQYFPAYDFGGLSEVVDTCIRETASALNDWAGGV